MNSRDFVIESNRIEGITREPTGAELDEFERFIDLPDVSIDDLTRFVRTYQPGAKLRDTPGLDVRVGNHVPPRGGTYIVIELGRIIDLANKTMAPEVAHKIHIRYESLHPFTDGNGRSGRMLWAWMMGSSMALSLGFLHRFYYQTLDAGQEESN